MTLFDEGRTYLAGESSSHQPARGESESDFAMLVCPADGAILPARNVVNDGVECHECGRIWDIELTVVQKRQ